MARHIITDEMWGRIKPLLPKKKSWQGRRRKDDREMIEAILWVHRTGAPWRDLPEEFGPWESAYTRFYRWSKAGVWEQMLSILKKKLPKRAAYDGGFDDYPGSSACLRYQEGELLAGGFGEKSRRIEH